jgi:hypothetical protein
MTSNMATTIAQPLKQQHTKTQQLTRQQTATQHQELQQETQAINNTKANAFDLYTDLSVDLYNYTGYPRLMG